ncbi:MAG TPA: calcium/proton exchanger [Chloroflexota bacterium]|nr:calcium/proton exchanger [Chloroflexota bacterium]
MTTTAHHQTLSWGGVAREVLLGNKLNALLVFLPLSIVLELLHAADVWIFVTASLAIVPLAGMIGHATEELSLRSGPGIGGFLNATFGNAAELLIAGFALAAGLPDVVKASLSGSILGNILLVLGAAFFFGGLGRERQTFSATGASAKTLMLLVAVAGMVMPAVFDLTVLGSFTATNPALDTVSLLTAIVLLLAYGAGLVFSLRTHSDVFSEAADDLASGHVPTLTRTQAVAVLLVATALTALGAETLVSAVEGAAHSLGMTDLFVGFVVVAVVGNAAEHFSAIVFARRNQMQLAINIAKDSSVQIALLVAPVLVIFSFLLGHPMNLVFHPFELFGIVLAVFAVTFASLDGESNWFEGILLLALYVIVAIATYFVPASTVAATAGAH